MIKLSQKVSDTFRGLKQRYGTQRMKKRLWDNEYSRGRWGCLDQMEGDCLYAHVERHSRNGSILDLGCGPGTTGNELDAAGYQFYTGVEISQVATEKARARTRENGRAAKNRFFQSDLFSYVPDCQHDVILFGDSIYYVPPRRIQEMLDRYVVYLKPGGVFVVRSWVVSHRHRSIIEIIERNLRILEREFYHYSQGVVIVLVFQPQSANARKAQSLTPPALLENHRAGIANSLRELKNGAGLGPATQ